MSQHPLQWRLSRQRRFPSPQRRCQVNLVTQEFATVNSTFGVNARFSPDTDAAIIRILEDGERLFVFSQQGEWLEVFVADTPLTEGQLLSGTVGFAATEFFSLATQEITEGLRDQVLGYAGKLPTPEPTPIVEPTVARGCASRWEAPLSQILGRRRQHAPILTVTINAINGVNVRRAPVTDDTNIIRLLENGTVLPATGRSPDNLWIQVALPDGVSGWIAAEFLLPSADITTLPVVDAAAELPVATPATPGGAPVDATDVVTSGVEPPPPYTSVIPSDSSTGDYRDGGGWRERAHRACFGGRRGDGSAARRGVASYRTFDR